MATTPQFATTPLVGHVSPSATIDAHYGGAGSVPTVAQLLVTAGANGSKIEQIDVVGTGTTIAGVIVIFMYDGTTYWGIDEFVVTAVTPSTTLAPFYASHTYNNLIIPNASFLYITSTVASQIVNVNAYGASF